MDINYFVENRYNPSVLIPQLRKNWAKYCRWEAKAFFQYDPILHDIVQDRAKRPDRHIRVPDPTGSCDVNGEPNLVSRTVIPARIPLALQRLIVSRASAFLTGGRIELKSKPEERQKQLDDIVRSTWKNNKLQFKNNDIARRFMSETECCEIWYSDKSERDGKATVKMRMNIYSPSKGFELVPYFDNVMDLKAFGLGYKDTINGKEVDHMDIYDSEFITYYRQGENNDWTEYRPKVAHGYRKIPVIYYNIERAIWSDVQTMIERLEYLISNFADTNDYNGSPILFAKGNIQGFSAKGETGKVIEGKDDEEGKNKAELSYVTWDQAPESIKLEIETLLDFIYTITQTPNISFKEMKGLGDISGVAFDRMMIDAHLKATDMQNGMYGECIQRRLNFLIAACAVTNNLESANDLEIAASFSLFSIDDVRERIDNAMVANGGLPVIDHKSSIGMAGLSEDVDETFAAIQGQAKEIVRLPNALAIEN